MGESKVKLATTQKQLQVFEQALLKDIRALDRMLKEGWFEIDKTRIGAEQEFCLIDRNLKPAPLANEMLSSLNDESFTEEFALFNLEINALPREYKGNALSLMEEEIKEKIQMAREAAGKLDSQIVMSGILPTIRKYDVGMNNIMPLERYFALCQAINKLRGSEYDLKIQGVDDLSFRHDSPLLEAANTGFQVHLQIRPDKFVKMYNIAQAITGPVLAAATFSPVLFGKRLWAETRVALFEQSVDTRKSSEHLREKAPRVTFGNSWLENSILDIYKEDIVRYRVLLSSAVNEDVVAKLDSGETPDLLALKVHNGTVYRWNRPCYGISDGKAHLRIENRVLPSGPTVLDEVANAAFWLGLMTGMDLEIDDVTKLMDFSDARGNFIGAAQFGIDKTFNWFDGKKIPARELILDTLLPIAHKGLKAAKIDKGDIDRYLGVIEERVKSGQTGSTWILDSYHELASQASEEEMFSAITSSIIKNQEQEIPVHKWDLASLEDLSDWKPSDLLVEESMTKDIFTVHKDDIVQLVSEMMDWKKLRYVLVEDGKGKLLGLVSSRKVMREYAEILFNDKKPSKSVKDVMITDVLTINPEAKLTDAMDIMRQNQIGALPVVTKSNKLVGIITEQTFIDISARLMKRLSKKNS